MSFSSITTLTVILNEHHFALFLCWVGSPFSPHIAPAFQQLQWLAVHFHVVLESSPPNPSLGLLSRNFSDHLPTLQRSQVTLCLPYPCPSCLFVRSSSPWLWWKRSESRYPRPQDIWTLTSLPTFESRLKIHLFRPAFPSETVTIKCIFLLCVLKFLKYIFYIYTCMF